MNDIYYIQRTSIADLIDLGVNPSNIYDVSNGMFQAALTEEQAAALIPEGAYCYTRKNGKFSLCPFWDKISKFPEQSNGFCHYLKAGDFTKNGTFLLWDQCKECGVKEFDLQDDENVV